MFALVAASAIAIATPSSAASSAPVAITVSSRAPQRPSCEHRAFCGPLRLLPRDPVERRAFVARVVLQAADGIVTAAGLRAGRGSYRALEQLAPCPAGSACQEPAVAAYVSGQRGSRPQPTWEGDPFVAPSSHGGLITLLIGGLAWDATTSLAQRRWRSAERAHFDLAEAGSHAMGMVTWLPRFAARRALDARYAKCVREVAGVAGDNANPTALLLNGAEPPGPPLPPHATHECDGFTTLPQIKFGQ
jgi:hypothetical protein